MLNLCKILKVIVQTLILVAIVCVTCYQHSNFFSRVVENRPMVRVQGSESSVLSREPMLQPLHLPEDIPTEYISPVKMNQKIFKDSLMLEQNPVPVTYRLIEHTSDRAEPKIEANERASHTGYTVRTADNKNLLLRLFSGTRQQPKLDKERVVDLGEHAYSRVEELESLYDELYAQPHVKPHVKKRPKSYVEPHTDPYTERYAEHYADPEVVSIKDVHEFFEQKANVLPDNDNFLFKAIKSAFIN